MKKKGIYEMNMFDWSDSSLVWKLICGLGATNFVLVAIILGLMGLDRIKVLEVEVGVITPFLGFLALYGASLYLARHKRRR